MKFDELEKKLAAHMTISLKAREQAQAAANAQAVTENEPQPKTTLPLTAGFLPFTQPKR